MTAAEILATARVVLLDFDGPVTPLMPPPVNAHAAEDVRAALRVFDVDLPPPIQTTTDHMAILRWTGTHRPELLGAIEQACAEVEITAAKTCQPTFGADALLTFCQEQAKPVVIVSNNTEKTIHTYLARMGLAPLVYAVIGRPAKRPDLMKPHPHIVVRALAAVGASPRHAVLIGDSVTDIQVARATGVRSIGYAKTAVRGRELAAAGADVTVRSMDNMITF